MGVIVFVLSLCRILGYGDSVSNTAGKVLACRARDGEGCGTGTRDVGTGVGRGLSAEIDPATKLWDRRLSLATVLPESAAGGGRGLSSEA